MLRMQQPLGIFAQAKAAEPVKDIFLEGLWETLPCPSAGLLEAMAQSVDIRGKSEPVPCYSSDWLVPTSACIPDSALDLSDQHRPSCVFL